MTSASKIIYNTVILNQYKNPKREKSECWKFLDVTFFHHFKPIVDFGGIPGRIILQCSCEAFSDCFHLLHHQVHCTFCCIKAFLQISQVFLSYKKPPENQLVFKVCGTSIMVLQPLILHKRHIYPLEITQVSMVNQYSSLPHEHPT